MVSKVKKENKDEEASENRRKARDEAADNQGNQEMRGIKAVHAEAGQNVRLAGSFTDWETKAKKMAFKKQNGVYTATVKLAPGEYQYKFIIGDKWATDDQNTEFVPNDKGTFNSKLVVK